MQPVQPNPLPVRRNLLQRTDHRDPVRASGGTVEAVLASFPAKAPQTELTYRSEWLEVGIARAGCASLDVDDLSAGAILEVVIETALTRDASDPYGPRVLKEIATIDNGEKAASPTAHRRVSFEGTDRFVRVAATITKGASASYAVMVQLGP